MTKKKEKRKNHQYLAISHSSSEKHWSNETNRREVFDNFAKENGFDPLIAESWYFASPTVLREAKV